MLEFQGLGGWGVFLLHICSVLGVAGQEARGGMFLLPIRRVLGAGVLEDLVAMFSSIPVVC